MMKPLTTITSIAAPIPQADIDTDVIYPARYLVTLDKTGLGQYAFFDWRLNAPKGEPFVLDAAPFDIAEILVAGAMFGIGSSREHAVWSLADRGIRVIIAPSFGEIFQTNCYKNGLLPITLGGKAHARVMDAAAAGQQITVDLDAEEIRLSAGAPVPFSVDPARRNALLAGLDEIGAILADHSDAIARFEEQRAVSAPWLSLTGRG